MEFEVTLTKNRLTAEMLISSQGDEASCSVDDLLDLLKTEKVIFGIKMDVLEQIAKDPDSVDYPVEIAAGNQKIDGIDAYLQSEIKDLSLNDRGKFNFRFVMQIPSVKQGQLLATIIPAVKGTPGMDVTGKPITARDGRPIKIKTGNNVLYKSGQYFAITDGQVSITDKSISVNPVFEVKGDLDLKTGNIDFVGNITIKGNVPSGYELKAGGDIWVSGLVEAANLHAKGNIIVEGGITGGLKGSITAGGNVQANYLNQAIVKADQNIYVKSSILHSKVTAGGEIDCKTGTIIGGTLTAGRNIHVKGLGNELFTKTELAVGWDPLLEKMESETIKSIDMVKENINKLSEIELKLVEIGKHSGKLSAEQQQLIHKQRATRMNMENQLMELREELTLLQAEKTDRSYSSLFVYEKVFPNAKVFFGKYALMTNQNYQRVVFNLENSEVRIRPFEGKVNV
ncbi:MAG TPA: hypothetical protein DCR24_01120 [Bacillus bacterium]|nr:hypothetical protein [Bacillus sp. (in: firmicutes)]